MTIDVKGINSRVEQESAVIERIRTEIHRAHRREQSREALLQEGGHQSLLVAEVVIDRGCRVAAASGQVADRELIAAALDHQSLGRVQNRSPCLAAMTLPTRLGRSRRRWNVVKVL